MAKRIQIRPTQHDREEFELNIEPTWKSWVRKFRNFLLFLGVAFAHKLEWLFDFAAKVLGVIADWMQISLT